MNNEFCYDIVENKVLQEITQAVFNDDLKLHFKNQSKITIEDNTIRDHH